MAAYSRGPRGPHPECVTTGESVNLNRHTVLLGWLVLLLASPAAAQASDPLTLPLALDRALSAGRPERVAAAARANLPGASLRPDLEFALTLGRSGHVFGQGDEKSAALEVSRRFDPFGRTRSMREASALEQRAVTLDAGIVARNIALEVRRTFHGAALADRHLALLTGLTTLDRARVTSTQARVRDGDLTPLAGRLAALDLLDSETRLELARSEAVQARLALAIAMGIAADSLATCTLVASDQLDTLTLAISSIEDRTRSRPELLAARQRVAAAERAQRAAQLAGRPEFTLGLELEASSRRDDREVFLGDPGGLQGLSSRDRGMKLRVSAPWIARENVRVERTLAAAHVASSVALASAEERRAVGAARSAADRFASETRIARLHRAQIPAITADIARVSEAYRDGRIGLEVWLAYQQRLYSSLAAAFDAEARYWDARATLEATVGVSFEELQSGGRR